MLPTRPRGGACFTARGRSSPKGTRLGTTTSVPRSMELVVPAPISGSGRGDAQGSGAQLVFSCSTATAGFALCELLRRRRRGPRQRAQPDPGLHRDERLRKLFKADGIAYPELCDRLVKLTGPTTKPSFCQVQGCQALAPNPARPHAEQEDVRVMAKPSAATWRCVQISIWNWPGSSLAWGSLVIQMRKDLADLPGGRRVSVAPPLARVATGSPSQRASSAAIRRTRRSRRRIHWWGCGSGSTSPPPACPRRIAARHA